MCVLILDCKCKRLVCFSKNKFWIFSIPAAKYRTTPIQEILDLTFNTTNEHKAQDFLKYGLIDWVKA